MPDQKLALLANEADRQRAIDAVFMNMAFNANKDVQKTINSLLSVHGAYTEGFHEQQLDQALEALRGMTSGR